MSRELQQAVWPPGESGATSTRSPLDVARVRTRKPIVAGAVGAALVHACLIALAVALAQSEKRPQARWVESAVIEAEVIRERLKAEPEPAVEFEKVSERERVREREKMSAPVKVSDQTPMAADVHAPAPKAKKVASVQQAAPAAAQAAKVLAAEPKEVLDFGETFVQGNAASYAGGVTASGGTSRIAVRDANARAFGVDGGKGSGAVDLTREPSLADGVRWDCPFPEEADENGLDSGVVTLRVTVSADGAVSEVSVKSDPGYGFGREARRCALQKRWRAARDERGRAVTATKLLNVRFRR